VWPGQRRPKKWQARKWAGHGEEVRAGKSRRSAQRVGARG